MIDFNTAESLGRIENIIRIGEIAAVDNAKRLVRVRSAELLSDWIHQPAQIGNNFIAWTPMRVGTQVVVGCPSGDFAQAVILQVLYTDELNSPSTAADTDMIKFNDGTVIKKDAATLTIDTPCAVNITAPNAVITADTTINGAVAIIGESLTHNGKNVGDDHKHKGIATGPYNTGDPV